MNSKSIIRLFVISAAVFLPAAAAFGSTGEGNGGSIGHRMMLLAIQLGVIILAARMGGLLFRKFRLPNALGELIMGVVAGPFAMGGMAIPGFPDGVLGFAGASAVSPELQAIASVAAVVLMFDVGLETDLKLLLKYSFAGGIVGIGGMVVSFLAGCACVKGFSDLLYGQSLDLFAPPCLFVGTITTATSIGITARLLSERKKLDSPEGVTILTAAVIDDVLGIIVLAIVIGIVSSPRSGTGSDFEWGHVGWISFRIIAIWIGATAAGLLASRLISTVLKQFKDWNVITVMALALTLILAGLFEQAGLAMIVGAFVMGLSLSRSDISHVIREKLVTIRVLLVPTFFFIAGMKIDIGVLVNPQVLLFGLVFAFAAMAAKVIGCGLPSLAANFNLIGALRIGFGMAPRCEVALIVTGVGAGYSWAGQPLLGSGIFAAVIIMILFNTIIAPPILSHLIKIKTRGTRKPVRQDKDRITLDFEFPSVEMADFFIRKLVVVFEQEGFFVHLVDRSRQLFHLRKDDTVIQFVRNGNQLDFSCYNDDVLLVRTAVSEAMAAFEEAIGNMKKPMDARSMARIQDAAENGKLELDLGKFLTPELVRPALRGTTKEEIIEELMDILDEAGLVADREQAMRAVIRREESLSTGLEKGIAIPHARTDTVDHLICAVGIKQDGVDFDSLDGSPSRIFILTLSPESRPAPHIQFMASVNRILDDNGRTAVLAGGTAKEICDVFTGHKKGEVLKETPFDVRNFIHRDLIRTDLKGTTGEEVIREMVSMIAEKGLLRNSHRALEVVLNREKQMSTGMEEGIAIPHGRTDEIRSLTCAVGIKKEGIDFGAPDGKPSTIFLLVLTPVKGSDPYLQFVASMLGKLDVDGRAQILQAETPQDAMKVFL